MKRKYFTFDCESAESPGTSFLLSPVGSLPGWSDLLSVNHCALLEGFPLLDSSYHTVLLPSCVSGQFSLTSPKTGIPQGAVLPLFFSLSVFLTPEKVRAIF